MRNTKSKIILVMCIAICFMVVGYAAFSTSLSITGTANIASEWKVVFTKIEEVSKTSGVSIKSTPAASGTTATFNVGLTSPGDKIVYKITLANQGTIDAVIKNIQASATDSPAIIFTVEGVNTGDVINNKTSRDFTVTIEYDPHVTSQPDKLQKTLTVSIVTEQYVNQSIDSSTPNVNQPTYLRSEILKNNIAYADTNIDFSKTSEETGTNGLYYTNTNTEGNKTTYYFRGDVDNNYVKLGSYVTNTCTYNGGDVTYLNMATSSTNISPTQEECVSTNVCDLNMLGVGYVVGLDQTTCQQLFDRYMQEQGSPFTSAMMSCLYNGVPIVGMDSETGNPISLTESECLSNNVCIMSGEGLSIGIGGLDQATCLEMGGQWPNAKANSYNATFPYMSDKATSENVTKDRLWRIVRINEDGSIRIITEDAVGESVFNTKYDDNAYVGYMYGTTGQSGNNAYNLTHSNDNPSTIKTYLDTWYTENLSSYSSYLADAGFCNDRSVAPSSGLWASNDTALGYAKNVTYYGAYNRLFKNGSPQFACPNEARDLFTTSSSTKGNKALTNPIGLLTADELWYAGATTSSNQTYYLYTGASYWTMSPVYFYSYYASNDANEWRVYDDGSADFGSVDYENGVRPVVNLQSGVEITGGNGTFGNPYVIK